MEKAIGMPNIIITIILMLIIAFGIKETIKHFKGEGACCGGSSLKIKKKKLKNKIIKRYILKINGMHCNHCVNTVTMIINDFEGAAGRVDLKKKQAIILCDRDIDIDAIKERIIKKGYEVL